MNLPRISALILGLGLLLTACGGSSTTTPNPNLPPTPDLPTQTDFTQPTAITGTVQDVGVIGSIAQLGEYLIGPYTTVKSDGSFSLKLPSDEKDLKPGAVSQLPYAAVQADVTRLEQGGGCTGQIAFVNPTQRVFRLETLLYQPSSGAPVSSFLHLQSGTVQTSEGVQGRRYSQVQNMWVFASGRASARGTLVCKGGFMQANLQLKAGWNAVTAYLDSVGGYTGTRYLSADPKPVFFGSTQLLN